MELKSFSFAFQLTKRIVFEINYTIVGSNTNRYFATSALEFNQPKNGFIQCGQAQNDLCSGKAMEFYKKWDSLHCKDLTETQYHEIRMDIEALKQAYNYIETDTDNRLSFYELKVLTMQKVKK